MSKKDEYNTRVDAEIEAFILENDSPEAICAIIKELHKTLQSDETEEKDETAESNND